MLYCFGVAWFIIISNKHVLVLGQGELIKFYLLLMGAVHVFRGNRCRLRGIFFLGGFLGLGLHDYFTGRDVCEGNCLVVILDTCYCMHYTNSLTGAKPNIFLCYVSNLYFDTSTTE